MWPEALLSVLLLVYSAHSSGHSDADYEEHKSGYGYVDQTADFSRDGLWFDSAVDHSSDSHQAQASEHHKSSEKFADSGAKKHSDEAVNRGKDSKQRNYGFFDYHFVEPQYRLEKFYTNEQRSKKFDEGERNHVAASHHTSKDHANQADQHLHQAANSHTNSNKFDRLEHGQHGHRELQDEHYNRLDKNAHTFESGPFKDGHYIPRFAPY